MADFLMTPQTLAEMDKVPVRNFFDAQDWQNRAQTIDRAVAADAPWQMEMARRKKEADLAELTSQTATRQAQLPGVQAEAEGKVRDWNVRKGIPQDQEVKAKLSAISKTMADDDLHTLSAKAKAAMLSATTPDEFKRAETIYNHSAEVLAERRKHADELEKVRLQGQNAKEVANIYSSGRERVAGIRAKGASGDIETIMAKFKTAGERISALTDMLNRLDPNAEDYAEKAAEINRRIVGQIPQYDIENKNKLAAGQMVQGPDGKWGPAQATPMTPPAGANTQPAARKEFTFKELQDRYPNATEKQIRDAAAAKGITIK